MIVQGAFNLLFRPGLRSDFRDSYDQFDTEYDKYLKTGTIDGPEIAATIMTGLSRLYERGDGEKIIYEDPKLGPKVIGVDKEFAAGFIVTRRTVEDDKYNKANQGAKWLAHAARLTMEYRGAAVLDDAFDGNFFRTIDNKPLIDTAHTLINSDQTVSNEIDPAVEFSVTGMTSAFDLMSQMKDENGDPIPMTMDTLILGSYAADFNTALAIWHSSQEPFTSDNTDNVTKRRMPKPKIVVSHYKTNRRSWFLQSTRWNDAHLLIRRAVEFDDDFDFDTDAAKYKASTRFLIWVIDWRGWIGSNVT